MNSSKEKNSSLFTQVQIQLSAVMAHLARSRSQRLDTKLAAFGKQLVTTSLRSVRLPAALHNQKYTAHSRDHSASFYWSNCLFGLKRNVVSAIWGQQIKLQKLLAVIFLLNTSIILHDLR